MLLPMCLLCFASAALASKPSPEKGKAISVLCATCHGNMGKAVDTSYPNLTGQNYQYLVQAIENFKTGERRNSIMQSITSGLSEKQIKDVAAYYASVSVADCKKN